MVNVSEMVSRGTVAPAEGGSVERLSGRQRQCLELVAEGYTSKQIARELELSPSTVDNHLNAAVERLGLSGRAEAARALRNRTPSQDKAAAPRPPSLLRLPPVGGSPNRLSLGRRYFHVVQIALLGTMAMTAIVMTIAGLVQLFNR